MNVKTIYADRAEAIDACDATARETGRDHVLMSYMIPGTAPGAFRSFVVRRSTWENSPLQWKVQTPHGEIHPMYDGYMFGPQGRI
jgi:hypothetical protein